MLEKLVRFGTNEAICDGQEANAPRYTIVVVSAVALDGSKDEVRRASWSQEDEWDYQSHEEAHI